MKKLLILSSMLLMILFAGCADESSSNIKLAGTIIVPNQLGSIVEITNTVKQEEVWPIPVDFAYVLMQPVDNVLNSVVFAFSVADPNTVSGIEFNETSNYTGMVYKLGYDLNSASLETPYMGYTRIALVDYAKANEVIAKVFELYEFLLNIQTPALDDYVSLKMLCSEIIEMTKDDTYIYKLYVEN